MKTKHLTNSIIVILLLTVLLIAQRVTKHFLFDDSYITISINICILISTIIYYLQVQYNFKHYLLIDNIRKQIISIVISYIIMYSSVPVFQYLRNGKTFQEMPQQDKIISGIFMLLSGAAAIIWIIQQIILANKLIRNTNNIEVRRLGYSIYSLFIFFIIIPLLSLTPALKPFRHVVIIGELLPLFFAFKIYRKLLNDKNDISEAEVL